MSDIEQKKARLKAAKEQMRLALVEMDRAMNDLGSEGWELDVSVERLIITQLVSKKPRFGYSVSVTATRTEEI